MFLQQRVASATEKAKTELLLDEYKKMYSGVLYGFPNLEDQNIVIAVFSGLSFPKLDEEDTSRHFSYQNGLRTIQATLFFKLLLAFFRKKRLDQLTEEEIKNSNINLVVIGGGPDQEFAMKVTAQIYLPKEKVTSIADKPYQSNTMTQSKLLDQHPLVKNADLVIVMSEPFHIVRTLHTVTRWIDKPVTAISTIEGYNWNILWPKWLYWIGKLGIPLATHPFDKETMHVQTSDEVEKIEKYGKNDNLQEDLPSGYWYGGLTSPPVTYKIYKIIVWIKFFLFP